MFTFSLPEPRAHGDSGSLQQQCRSSASARAGIDLLGYCSTHGIICVFTKNKLKKRRRRLGSLGSPHSCLCSLSTLKGICRAIFFILPMKQRLGRCHSPFRKTELFQQKTRPGSHPGLPESRSIASQQLLLPAWAITSACPEKASDTSTCPEINPEPTSPHCQPSPWLTSSFLFPTKQLAPLRTADQLQSRHKSIPPTRAAAAGRAVTGTHVQRPQGTISTAQPLCPRRWLPQDRGGRGGPAQLARHELCSTRGTREAEGTWLRASVWCRFTPPELSAQDQHAKEPTETVLTARR